MSSKPVVWMPRRLSDATIARAKQGYEVVLNEADTPGTAEDIIAMSDGYISRFQVTTEKFMEDWIFTVERCTMSDLGHDFLSASLITDLSADDTASQLLVARQEQN